jgi:ATP-dependent 26S proteasome regulatory subunit
MRGFMVNKNYPITLLFLSIMFFKIDAYNDLPQDLLKIKLAQDASSVAAPEALDSYALYNRPVVFDQTLTFKDIIGGVPAEIEDLKKFIECSIDYDNAGAIMPKGYLFYGPPGTGKTLLARALAGEVDAAFFALSGASFVGKYVGDGVRKVQETFNQAKNAIAFGEYKYAIIFIDELDSIGHRSSDDQAAAQDSNRTINELLVQMDGFSQADNIIVIGATNMLTMIDDALKRSGRFEMHIEIKLPDAKKREALLKYYTSSVFNRKIAKDVNLAWFAQETKGFNCADIALFVNKAAIYVARQKQTIITVQALLAVLEEMKK